MTSVGEKSSKKMVKLKPEEMYHFCPPNNYSYVKLSVIKSSYVAITIVYDLFISYLICGINRYILVSSYCLNSLSIV